MQTCSLWSTESVSTFQKRSNTFTLDFVKAERLIGQFKHTSAHADLLFTSSLKKGGWDVNQGMNLFFFIKYTLPAKFG